MDINLLLTVFIGLIFFIMISMLRVKKSDPSPTVKEDSFKKLEKIKPDEPNTTFLGMTQRKKKIRVKNDSTHFFVAGTTGSGKTVCLSNFVESAVINNSPLVILDGKGDTGEGSLFDIVNKVSDKRNIYIVNLSDPSRSDKYNPFKDTEPDTVKDMLINLTEWTEPHYKLNSELYIQKVCNLLQQANIELGFKTIVEYLNPEQLSMLSKKLADEKIITKEEHAQNGEFIKDIGKIASGSFARFGTILASSLGTIFDEDGIDITTAIKENAILLFVLNPLKYPELSPLIGKLIITDYKKAVSNNFGDTTRKLFMFDEISSYANNGLLDLVNKSRSANCTCILATQSVMDLKVVSDNYHEQIIENCNSYIILRQNSAKGAEFWSDTIGTKATMQHTYQVDEDGATGKGSVSEQQIYLYHPNVIKALTTGQAIYINKNNGFHTRLSINKPF